MAASSWGPAAGKTSAQGQFICPEHVKSNRGPRRAAGPLGYGRKGPLRAPLTGTHPQSSGAAGDGRGGTAEGMSFRAGAEANDLQLVPTRWSCTSNQVCARAPDFCPGPVLWRPLRGPRRRRGAFTRGGRNSAAENRQISSDNRMREGYNGDRTQTEGAEPMERAEWKEYRDCVAALLAAPEGGAAENHPPPPGGCPAMSTAPSCPMWPGGWPGGGGRTGPWRPGRACSTTCTSTTPAPCPPGGSASPTRWRRPETPRPCGGGLSSKEENCILAHMWPLSVRMPHSREAAAVCLADKLCSVAEVLHVWRRLALRRAMLSPGEVTDDRNTGTMDGCFVKIPSRRGGEIVQAS